MNVLLDHMLSLNSLSVFRGSVIAIVRTVAVHKSEEWIHKPKVSPKSWLCYSYGGYNPVCNFLCQANFRALWTRLFLTTTSLYSSYSSISCICFAAEKTVLSFYMLSYLFARPFIHPFIWGFLYVRCAH